ncbi:MAG: PKD domain-containing protein [Clostridium sp.]|nr:PKD domain-containing protein [Clostridium sp.]
MKKHYLMLSSLLLSGALTLGAEPFETLYDFDNQPEGSILPEGWLNDGSQFGRYAGTYFGMPAKSGEYVLGRSSANFDEVLYTPLVSLEGGKPCQIEFWYYAPGGTPALRCTGLNVGFGQSQEQSTHTQILAVEPKAYGEWTRFVAEATPETDGDYCFSIATVRGQLPGDCGVVLLDDVIVSGLAPSAGGLPEFEPDPENIPHCQELPMVENFSDPTHFAEYMNYPDGWASTGSNIFRVASIATLDAQSGQWYLISPESSVSRDEAAYTPFFNLEAGTTYTMSFYTFIQGREEDGVTAMPTLDVTVGTQQDGDFHAPLLTVSDYRNMRPVWDRREVTFTPAVSGPYCFSFRLSGQAYSGFVAIDNVHLSAPGLIDRVEPGFAPQTMYNLMDSHMTVFAGDPVPFANTTRYADEYLWVAEGATPGSSTEFEPSFVFLADGTYTVSLTASNSRGSRTVEHTYDIRIARDGQTYAMTMTNESADRALDRGEVPAFSTDPADYITGYNHYYHTYAQRYDLSPLQRFELRSLSFRIAERRFRNMTTYLDDQRIKPMAVVVYGSAEDGSIDPEKVLARYEGTIGDFLGSSGLGGNYGDPRQIDFPTPATVSGTVYVALEFSPEMTVDPEDEFLGRSYVATGAVRFASGVTTLYALAERVAEASGAEPGQWLPLDQIDPEMAGYGADWQLWMVPDGGLASIAVNPAGEQCFAARFDGDCLTVSGTTAGQTISVCDASGRVVASVAAGEDSTVVGRFPRGLYIVSIPCSAAVKVAR